MATMTVPERPAGLPSRPPAIAAGARIGRYIVDGEIGRGGMGVILSAEDPSLLRRIALKLVRPDDKDPQAAERMLREARAMASLAHPNVVTIHDVGAHDDGQIFLAMELVEGRSLRLAIREELPVATVLDLFLQAGRGLAAAHDAGLVHRDFKPDNVLVGHDGRARVTDFGLVRGDDDAGPATGRPRTLTAAGTIVGTPAYMAPEQHIGVPPSQEADQFSFAVSLYEALAGERPFEGTFEEMQAAKLGPGRKPWPPNKPIPPSLTNAIDRALVRDPRARYPSMRDFLAAIEAAAPPPALASQPHVSGTPTAMSAPRVSGTPTAISAPLAPGAYPQYSNTRPPPPIRIVAVPPRPDRTWLFVLGGVGGLVVLLGLAWVAYARYRLKSSSSASSSTTRIAPPGPQPPAPAFVPVIPSPTPDSKFACPSGTTFHRTTGTTATTGGVIQLSCASPSSGTKDGPLLQFDSGSRGLTLHEVRLRGKLEGQVWTFAADGSPLRMTDYHEGSRTMSLVFSTNGKVSTRERYENDQRHGLTENWNAWTGQPVSAQLYQNGRLVGSSQ